MHDCALPPGAVGRVGRSYFKMKWWVAAVLALALAGEGRAGEIAPRLDLSLLPGTDRILGSVDVFWPVLQWESQLLFLDFRTLVGSRDVFEGNAGLGYRRSVGDWVLGAHAFADHRRSEHGNWFRQATVGLEAQGSIWEFRANAYLPENVRKPVGSELVTPAASMFSGTTLLAHGNVFRDTFERPLRGFDLEVGRPLTLWPSIRAYAAGYRFKGKGAPTTLGSRIRFEAPFSKRFTLGASVSRDRIRGTEGFLEFRWSLGRKPSAEARDRLADRFAARVVRDIDIFTSDKVSQTRGSAVFAPISIGGANLDVLFVQNNAAAGGDGTQANPFNSLALAEAASGVEDIIYIARGDGTTTGQNAGVTLKNDQKLIGEGVALVVSGIQVLAAGTAPLITNTAGDAVTLADNNEVAGLNIASANNDGIVGSGITSANIHDNTISNAGQYGIQLANLSGTATITSNSISGSAASGVLVNNTGAGVVGSATVTGNTFTSNDNSFSVGAVSTSQVTATYSNNTSNGDNHDLIVLAQGNGQITLTAASNNSTRVAAGSAFAVAQAEDDSIVNLTFTNNVASAVAGGVLAISRDDAQFDLTASGNAISNTEFGLAVAALNNSQFSFNFTSNTLANGTDDGIAISAGDNSTVGGTMTSNALNNNAEDGIDVSATGTSDVDILLVSNTATGNTDFGINIDQGGTTNICAQLLNNTSDTDYRLFQKAPGTFNAENTLGTNTGTVNQFGTINLVAQGTCTP